MGFFKKLFSKKQPEDPVESDWDRVQIEKEKLNLSDSVVRIEYVQNCLEQMKEASDELDRINAEYSVVTSYLMDMEEIENLQGEEKERIVSIAKHLHDLRKAHDRYVLSESLLSESEFVKMEAMEAEVCDGIKKMKEEEEYKEKVKSDLMRISREKSAYEYRKQETAEAITNSRGIAFIAVGAVVLLAITLLFMQLILSFDVKLGYYICIILGAIAMTVIYIRYADAVSENKKIIKTINELILLENKVKIRYVNNKNLLDYLHTKFGVTSAAQLQDTYERYVKEKEEKKRFERNEAVYEDELERLINALKKLHINDPQIWIHQTDALYDPREMVEIRHKLIGRRQKLRKQMEYNEQIAIEAGDEIKAIIKDYPDSAEEVLALVDAYEKEN